MTTILAVLFGLLGGAWVAVGLYYLDKAMRTPIEPGQD
jgi:hypothetical protein